MDTHQISGMKSQISSQQLIINYLLKKRERNIILVENEKLKKN